MAKFVTHKPIHNLGDFAHPTKSNALNGPMAKPIAPPKQRVLATAKVPTKSMPHKTKRGRG